MRKTASIMLLGSVAMLAACQKHTPAGQVAATVNGTEVTLQEINTELQAANVPPNVDKQQVQRALLQQVIERKLLTGAAHDKGLDKTPEFLAQKRRAEELLLAQTYAKQQLAQLPVPSAADIDKFMNDHADAFSKRAELTVDQIRFPRPNDLKQLAALEQDHSQDAVAKRLTELGIKYGRGTTTVDSASIPSPIMAQIDKLPASEPFVIPTPQGITINVITARKPVPIDQAKARTAAAAAWRQQKFAELIKQQLDSLKSGAKIVYQNGFGPPAPPAAAKGAPAGAPAAAAPAAS